ncbi:MAG: hypothetical protein OEY10_05910, partial [Nitrosopumilus sp.]|nr:hypothetical protein [Nitrosopumilus sp.]
MSGARINGKVYSLPLSQILSDEEGNLENHTVFSAKSMGQYEKNLEDFFFKEFYYYAMKWTQKSSVKSSIDLLESNASWATYYKSIFLESKDYNSLFFGDQGSKILEMLLGLELTFAINRLSIRHNMLEHRMAISKFNEQQNYSEESDPSTLAEQLKLANKKIRELGPSPFDENEYSKLESKYNSFLRQKDKTRISLSQNHEELLQLEKEIFKQNLALQTEAEDLTTARKAAHTNARRINELQEYIDLGIFFSNLEVKNCPHCESKISKQRKAREKEKQRCMLCNEPFSADDLDFSQHKEKIKNLKKDSTKISNDIKEKEKTVKKVEKTMAALTQKKDGIDSSQHIEKLNEIDKELEKINNK